MLTLDLVENIFLFLKEPQLISISALNKDFLYISIKISNDKTYSRILKEICKRDQLNELVFSTQLRKECELYFLFSNCTKFKNSKCFEYLIRRNLHMMNDRRFFFKLCKYHFRIVMNLIKEDLIDGNICENYLFRESNILSYENFILVLNKAKLDKDLILLTYCCTPEKFKVIIEHKDFPKYFFHEWFIRIIYPYFHGKINDNLIKKDIIKIWLSKISLENIGYNKEQILNVRSLVHMNEVVKEAFIERGIL